MIFKKASFRLSIGHAPPRFSREIQSRRDVIGSIQRISSPRERFYNRCGQNQVEG